MIWLLSFIFSFTVMAKFVPLDPELTNYKYPFPVSFYSVNYGGEKYRMAYMDLKPKIKNGMTVVLLHGKNFSGSYWEKTAKDLSEAGYRVIMPDQIGFGKSSKPENFPFTFQYLSQLTQELINELQVKNYLLVGHSMGGMLATRMALMYPQKVKKLVLVNPIGLEDWKIKVPYHNVMTNYAAELKNNEASIRKYQQTVYFDGKWKPEYDKNIEILTGWTLHPEYKRVAWNAALTTDMVFTQPVIYEMNLLKMPTLLLLGTRDRTAVGKGWATPKVQKELGRYDLLGKEVIKMIPQGKLVEMPGIGHMPQVEDYETYISHLKDFIKK